MSIVEEPGEERNGEMNRTQQPSVVAYIKMKFDRFGRNEHKKIERRGKRENETGCEICGGSDSWNTFLVKLFVYSGSKKKY